MRTTIPAYAIALAAAALACACTAGTGTAAEPLTSDELPAYGVNFGGMTPDQIHPDELGAAHMGLERAWWARVDDVHAYDEQMTRAAASNVMIVPILFGVWPGGYTSANRNDWRNFVAAIAERFGPETSATNGSFWREHPQLPYLPVRAWEIWNEENSTTFWTWDGTGHVSPADYYDALSNAHQVLRWVDPNARVVFGGLINFSADQHPALDFLAQVTNMPNGNCLYDAVAIHPYSNTVEQAVNKVQDTRARLDALGEPDVDIWITEVGWAIAGPWQRDDSGLIAQTPFTAANQYHQAKHIAEFAQAMDNHRADWHIGPTIWFNYMDVGNWLSPDGRWDFHSGLMGYDPNGQPTVKRKSWHAAEAAATRTQSVNLPKLRCAGQ